MSIIVVALGGNALILPGERGTFEEQMKNVRITCEHIVEMIKKGHKIIITHGNGPQVGNLLLQQEAGKKVAAPMPLDVCGSESQGLIGYMLQNTLRNLLDASGMENVPAVTIVTQVLVSKEDQAFQHPTKPIGPFYSKEEAESHEEWSIVEDAGRGWRRVVPSPIPLEIVEKDAIKTLVDSGCVVIASGGGGIPVVREDKKLTGVEAVIDKDRAGQVLAGDVGADIFMILTAVEKVCLNFGKPDQKEIDCMTVEQAKQYLEEGHFKPGSMKPKVTAAIKFLEECKPEGMVIITSPLKAGEALAEESIGTKIVLSTTHQ